MNAGVVVPGVLLRLTLKNNKHDEVLVSHALVDSTYPEKYKDQIRENKRDPFYKIWTLFSSFSHTTVDPPFVGGGDSR